MLIGYHVGHENAGHLVKRVKNAFASERPDTRGYATSRSLGWPCLEESIIGEGNKGWESDLKI